MIEALFYALLSGFGLSALIVPSTAFAMHRATDLSGATRHMIWLMVLIATVAATGAAFAVSAARPAEQLFNTALLAAAPPTPPTIHAAGLSLILSVTFITCWLIVSTARLILIARRINALRALKDRGSPVQLDCALPRGARALASDVTVPSAVGFLHPAILLPSSTITTLDPIDARQIVLHEAAHLCRRDDLTGLVSLVCAAILWFNPFIHYVGKQLSRECEIACDEIVVAQTGDAASYAALLFEVAKSIAGEGPQLAWTRFVHPSDLVARIQNVLLFRDARRAPPWPAIVLLIAVSLSSIGLLASNAPALSRTGNVASVHVRPMNNESATHKLQATDANQRVRDFAVCKPHNVPDAHDSGALNNEKMCEDPAMRFTPSTTRVKSGPITR